jgi:hypothetical protein
MGEQDTSATSPAHSPGTRKGEEIVQDEGKEPGREETGKTGVGRPTGESTARDSTGINPDKAEPQTPGSPTLPTP